VVRGQVNWWRIENEGKDIEFSWTQSSFNKLLVSKACTQSRRSLHVKDTRAVKSSMKEEGQEEEGGQNGFDEHQEFIKQNKGTGIPDGKTTPSLLSSLVEYNNIKRIILVLALKTQNHINCWIIPSSHLSSLVDHFLWHLWL